MPDFRINGEVTISVSTLVKDVATLEEAKKIASERQLQGLPYNSGGDEEDEWCHSGELDGEVDEDTIEGAEL